MTEKEINRPYWIKKEIEKIKKQKNDLDERSYVKGQEITDMPLASGTSDKTGDRAIAMQELNELYDIKLKEYYITLAKAERYIETIEDDRERLIIRLRCLNRMSFEEIGEELGYHRTRVSQIYRNHFKDSHNSHSVCDKMIL